jgi:hypothetical protein
VAAEALSKTCIGKSGIAAAFYIIRDALRRDVLLALMPLWDSNSNAVSMRSVANILRDTRVVDALAKESESHWHIRHHSSLDEMSREDRAILLANGFVYAREQSAALRGHVVEAIRRREARASVNRVVTGDVLDFPCRVLSEQAPALHWCPQPWQVHS